MLNAQLILVLIQLDLNAQIRILKKYLLSLTSNFKAIRYHNRVVKSKKKESEKGKLLKFCYTQVVANLELEMSCHNALKR